MDQDSLREDVPLGGADAAGIEAAYSASRERLVEKVACGRFGLSRDAAEVVVQDVFLTYLLREKVVGSVDSYLIGSVSNACKKYWRDQGRHELPAHVLLQAPSRDIPELLALQASVKETFARLDPKCREILDLHYFEGYSAREMADLLASTVRYMEKRIHTCLGRARTAYETLRGAQQ